MWYAYATCVTGGQHRAETSRHAANLALIDGPGFWPEADAKMGLRGVCPETGVNRVPEKRLMGGDWSSQARKSRENPLSQRHLITGHLTTPGGEQEKKRRQQCGK